MAKNSIRDFSATAGSNTDIQSVNIDENCPASGINNAIRELMVDLKNVSTGAVNLETPAADQLNVDNLRLDGNTISSTDTNGDITLDPNGTGKTVIQGGDSNYFFAMKGGTYGLRYNSNTSSSQMMIEAVDDTLAASHEPLFIGGSTVSLGIAGSEKVKVDASGNVGIGTSSPVSNSGFGGLTLNGNNGSILSLKDSDTEVARVVGSATEMSFQYGTSSVLTFKDGLSGGTERLRIDSSGGLRLGTTSNLLNAASNEKLSVKNTGLGHAASFQVTNVTGGFPILYLDSQDATAGGQNTISIRRGGSQVGGITTSASTTAFNTTSDHRLKENVANMTGAITRVKALAPKRFNFIVDADTTVDGFLAHEAQTVVPEAVTGTHNEVDDDGNAVMQGIDQSKLVPLLTGALQEAITKIETLETEMTALKARVTALEA